MRRGGFVIHSSWLSLEEMGDDQVGRLILSLSKDSWRL
jgi:hypothetical protein